MILRAWYPTRAKCLKPLRFSSIGDIFQWESQQQLPASIGLTGFITRLNFHCQTIGRRFGSKSEGDLVLLGNKTNFSILPREVSLPAFATQTKGKMN